MTQTVKRTLVMTDAGLILGRTVLEKLSDVETLVLLSIVSGKAILPQALGYIKCARKHHEYGDVIMRDMALALTGVPYLQNMQQVEKLSCAETMLCHGTTPLELLRLAGIEGILEDASARELYKFAGGELHKEYNPDESRVPAGNGKESGEWTDGGAGDG